MYQENAHKLSPLLFTLDLESVARIQTQHPKALIMISEDFNHDILSSHLTGFTQFVVCETKDNKTLDLMYANIKDINKSSPLGKSYQNLLLVPPRNKPQPTTT